MAMNRSVALSSGCLLFVAFTIAITEARGEEQTVPPKLIQRCEQQLKEADKQDDRKKRTAGTEACSYLVSISKKVRVGSSNGLALGAQATQPVSAALPLPPSGTPGPGPLPVNQRLFVRADRIDNLFYGVIPGYTSGQALGASISYTDNRDSRSSTGAISPTQNVMIDGTISYVLPPTPWNFDVDRFRTGAVALWVYGNGAWDHPIKPFSDSSVTKAGLDFQYSQKFPDGIVDDFLFNIAPYYETNFEGVARGFGTSFTLEPVVSSIYLGQSSGGNSLFNGFWILRPEADIVHISNLEYSNLTTGTYDWLGVTVRGYLFLFPSTNYGWPPGIADRVSLTGTAQYFRDANSGIEAPYYSVALQYNLNGCTTKDTNAGKCPMGSSSLSLEYDYGVDRDTMIQANKYLVKLNYKN
jgi:hypothetical protein